MKYCKLDNSNVVVQVQPDKADGFIECDDRVHCGLVLVNGLYEQPLKQLDDVQKDAVSKIDTAAESARLKFITPGAGQMLMYEFKRVETEKFLAATNPNAVDFPLMNERATRKGVPLGDVATEWQAKSDGWMAIAAQIEGLREGAKDAIAAVVDDANAQTSIDAIVNGITWPVPA